MRLKESNKRLSLILFSYLCFLSISASAGSHYTPYYIDGSSGQMKYGVKTLFFVGLNPWGGGYFEYRLLDYFAIETGLYYAMISDGLVPKNTEINEMKKKGQKKAQGELYSFNTISLPIIARFYPGEDKKISLFFGISMSALLSAKKTTIEYLLNESNRDIKTNLSKEFISNHLLDEYQEVEKGEVNAKGDALLNSISWHAQVGYTVETKFGLLFGLCLVMKLSKPFINYDKTRFELPSLLYIEYLKCELGYNVATLIYPEQYRTDGEETNIIPKYLKPYQESSYFVDHFIKFGPIVGQNLYAGNYGAFIEYKPIDRIGVVVGLNWGYMSYGVMPSDEDIKKIKSGNNGNDNNVPVKLIGINCLSLPLIFKTYFSGKQFAPFFGIRLAVLTSAKSIGGYYLDTKDGMALELAGVEVSRKHFEIAREIVSSDDGAKVQKINGDMENPDGKPVLSQIQIAFLVGFEYETEDGFIWGIKYDRPLSTFVNLDKDLNNQEIGNWTIMAEFGYNFSSLLHYYATM